MRQSLIGNRHVLILREPKPVPSEKKHECVVYHMCKASEPDNGSIIQCDCGKRYKCRPDRSFTNSWVWVRRILPWPPKQAWPNDDPTYDG